MADQKTNSYDMAEIKALAEFCQLLAKTANQEFAQIQAKTQEISTRDKSNDSFVTKYDLQLENRLRAMIQEKYPDHGIFGEELGTHNPNSKYIWLLDPIDGTTNFAHGTSLYGSIIGVSKQNKVIAAAIADPYHDSVIWAGLNLGCWSNSRKLRPNSRITDLKKATILLENGAKDHFKARLLNYLNHNYNSVRSIRFFGTVLGATQLLATENLDAYVYLNTKDYEAKCLEILFSEADYFTIMMETKSETDSTLDFIVTTLALKDQVIESLKKAKLW